MKSTVQVKTIVAALDGSGHASKAFDFATDLATKYGARLIALHVLSEKPLSPEEHKLAVVEYGADALDRLNADALMDVRGDPRALGGLLVQQYGDVTRQMRQAIAERLLGEAEILAKSKGVKGIETMIEEGNPANRILESAKDNHADMIVLGSRGLGDFKGLMMGSVSHKVSQMAKCTCITVK